MTYEHWQVGTSAVLTEVMRERTRQVERYGLNRDICDGNGPTTAWLGSFSTSPATIIEAELRRDYEAYEDEAGLPTWVHLIREEVAEAFAESDPEQLQVELIQVAALCVSWVERLRERGAKPVQGDGS